MSHIQCETDEIKICFFFVWHKLQRDCSNMVDWELNYPIRHSYKWQMQQH